MFRRFRSDRRGNITILFALSIVPILGFLGAALDYSRGAMVRTRLQDALDAAVLDVAQNAAGQSASAVTQAVHDQFAARFNMAQLSNFNLDVASAPGSLNASVTGDLAATLTSFLKITTITLNATSNASWGTQTVEVILVLDNTGSMADSLGSSSSTSKLQALQTAASNFVSYMQGVSGSNNTVKIGVVPFNTDVNVGTANMTASWIDTSNIKNKTNWNQAINQLCNSYYGSYTKYYGSSMVQYCVQYVNQYTPYNGGSWQGCIWDRASPYEVSNTAAVTSQPATLYQPDPLTMSGCGLAPIMALSSNWNTLQSEIGQMKPGGDTDLTVGLAWGFGLLSGNGATPLGTPNVTKSIVFMTDGMNTQDRFSVSNPSYQSNTQAQSDAQTQLDSRTTQVCSNIKSAGIQIYTVGTPDANASLLQGCASQPSMYYSITDTSQMNGIFQQIAGKLAQLRLAK